MAQEKIHDFNSRKQLLSKKYQQKKKMEDNLIKSQLKKEKEAKKEEPLKKYKRANPIFDDEKKLEESIPQKVHKRKKDAVDKFWDTIELLW